MHFIQAAKQFLSTQFRMKDLGELRYFIGIKVDRTKEGFFLSQKKYLTDVLKQYNMTHCKPLKVPMSPHVKLTADLGDPLPDASVYQQLIRKLIYLTLTRPDIAFSMHLLSQFMHKPTCVHLQAAKRVLKYLSGTINQGILLAYSSSASLTAYCYRIGHAALSLEDLH